MVVVVKGGDAASQPSKVPFTTLSYYFLRRTLGGFSGASIHGRRELQGGSPILNALLVALQGAIISFGMPGMQLVCGNYGRMAPHPPRQHSPYWWQQQGSRVQTLPDEDSSSRDTVHISYSVVLDKGCYGSLRMLYTIYFIT
jgi:hypothetical protein